MKKMVKVACIAFFVLGAFCAPLMFVHTTTGHGSVSRQLTGGIIPFPSGDTQDVFLSDALPGSDFEPGVLPSAPAFPVSAEDLLAGRTDYIALFQVVSESMEQYRTRLLRLREEHVERQDERWVAGFDRWFRGEQNRMDEVMRGIEEAYRRSLAQHRCMVPPSPEIARNP